VFYERLLPFQALKSLKIGASGQEKKQGTTKQSPSELMRFIFVLLREGFLFRIKN
jgi:hypothetical protein